MSKQTIQIERMAYGGEGIGRLEGKVCFVEGALPGEEAEIEVIQNKKSFLKARAVKILKASPHRIAEPCVYIKSCGGCQYQHLEYSEELRWKEIQVREYLSRNLKIPEEKIKAITGSSNPYHYRNSVTVHRAGELSGFVGEDNETVTPVGECLLADERLQPAFKTKWSGLRKKISYKLSGEGEFISEELDKIFPVSVGGKIIYTAPKSFFQNNLEITAKVGSSVSGWVKQFKPETFIDLYAGVGTFSVLAAHEAKKIICAEDSRHSQPALKMNLDVLGIPHQILDGSVENVFPDYYSKNKPARPFVFIDPPRVGMVPKTSQFLAAQNSIEALGYLSCHLGSLARDLGVLIKGGFEVEEALPFDMFPRTKHIEIAVLLKRK